MGALDSLPLFRASPAAEMLADGEVDRTFVDPGGIEAFWVREYLAGFIDQGAGKIKFVRGRSGAGKTHLLRRLKRTAEQAGYLVVSVDAHSSRLAAIDELYRAVAQAVNWNSLLDRCTLGVIRQELGYQDYELPVSRFRAWAENAHDRSQAALMTDIRDITDRFIRNLDIYAAVQQPIRASIVRRTGADAADESVLMRWLQGEKLTRQERKSIGVSTNVDRRNARALLLCLPVLARAASYKGLLILLDHAEVLSGTARTEGIPYYTRGTRDQAYEMIRELIDESYLAPYLFMVIAGSPDLFDNQKTGLPAYPALWNRIQTEIATKQVNRFHDIVDLDRLWKQEDLTRLAETWALYATEVELNGQIPDSASTTWGLEWGNARRAVAKAISSQNGGT